MDHGYLLKAAEKDRDLLYEWANDKETRKNSFHEETISYKEHTKWFLDKLHSQLCDIYIYYYDEKPIGQIRLDYVEDKAIINYSIVCSYRGQGHGRTILILAEEKLLEASNQIQSMYAEVKKHNIASQKMLEQLDFIRQDGEVIKYFKKLDNKNKSIELSVNLNKGGGTCINK